MMAADRTKPRLRLGLLLDSTLVSKYNFEFVKWCQSHERLEISHLFLLSSKQNAGSSRANCVRSAISNLFFRIVIGIERLFLLKNRRYHDHLQKFDLFALLPRNILYQLRDDDMFSIEEFDLDLLITFATCTSVNGICDVAKLGVISVSHSDDRIHRGGPAGFWEVYFRHDLTGFTIQRLTGVSDAGEVLLRGQVATQFYYLLNQASLCEKSIYYLTRLVEGIATTGEFPKSEARIPFCHRPRGVPRPHQTMAYLIGLMPLVASKIRDKVRRFDLRWHVAFVRSDWRNAALWRAVMVDNPRRHYLADPFVITRNGNDFCYVEDYDERTKRGRIAVYELGAHSATYMGVALEESFHLSYPYLFEYRGELYMCPETSENREIRIYKCVDFPLRWKLEKIVMQNVSAVDSMLFERNGKWWMLTNIDPAGWNDFSLELCLFSAKSPLEEDWVPHPGNPFFIDASRTRNGGMIKDGDRLFRVAQGQGFGMYGKQTSVNEILELSDDSYVEKCVCVISPAFRKGVVGTHHLNNNAVITIFDFACP